MPTFLSDAWVAALDDAARSLPALVEATRGIHLTLEQVVTPSPTDGDDPGSEATDGPTTSFRTFRWHLVVADGSVRFHPGAATDPTIRFTTDQATALAITMGQLSSTEAFMSGRLRIGGDTTALVAHHDLFAGVSGVFATVTLD